MARHPDLFGAYVTLITPFDESGRIDKRMLEQLVERQIAAGLRGICPTGVTGETAALTDDEKLEVISIVHSAIAGRVQHIPDIGTENYSRTRDLGKAVARMGVDSAIVLSPYLDIPTEEGMYLYFMNLVESLSIPIVLHNVPARTNVHMSPDVIGRLATHERITGIKNGDTSMEHNMEILIRTSGQRFSVLTGKDTLGLPLIRMGGDGHVSVAANVVPHAVVQIVEKGLSGDFGSAQEWYTRYLPFFKSQYVETNPIPTKYALNRIGLNVGRPRIPLTELSEKSRPAADELIRKLEISI